MGVFKEILRRAKYPYPRGSIVKNRETNDSISYKVGLDDYDLSMDFFAEYNHIRLPKEGGMPCFTIAASDTTLIDKLVDIYIVMGNGKVHKVENKVIED